MTVALLLRCLLVAVWALGFISLATEKTAEPVELAYGVTYPKPHGGWQ